MPVRFPFGFGLSYKSFAKSDWTHGGNVWTQTITNAGERFGAVVAQLYIDRELKGFVKVYLAPGETKTVLFQIRNSRLIQCVDLLFPLL